MRIAAIIFLTICAVSVLSLADGKKPSATVEPAFQFDESSSLSPTANSTTAPTKPTTSPTNTTTAPTKPTTSPTTNSTTAPTKPTTSPTNTTTAPTKPTTSPTNTTTAPTKPTTSPMTNSTTAPTKPTTSPTNTTTAPTKPTTAPTSTTAPPPPQPTPTTSVIPGNYNVTNDQKQICLKAQMALRIRLSTVKPEGVFIVQPNLTTAEGYCLETTANLTLRFKEGYITFLFNKSSIEDAVYVNALSFDLHYPLIEKGNSSYSANNKSLHLFAANVGHSYSCKKESFFMGNGLYLDVSEDRMQAFNLTKSTDFGTPDHCSADQPDHRVAIAVGVTLLVLIVIVVVAYLLSRRRRTDGYQSL